MASVDRPFREPAAADIVGRAGGRAKSRGNSILVASPSSTPPYSAQPDRAAVWQQMRFYSVPSSQAGSSCRAAVCLKAVANRRFDSVVGSGVVVDRVPAIYTAL